MKTCRNDEQTDMPDALSKKVRDDIRHSDQRVRFIDESDNPFPCERKAFRKRAVDLLVRLGRIGSTSGYRQEIRGIRLEEPLQIGDVLFADLDRATTRCCEQGRRRVQMK